VTRSVPAWPAPRRTVTLAGAEALFHVAALAEVPTLNEKSAAVGVAPAGRPATSIITPLIPLV
jgi:hypothetical protein